VQCSVIDVGSEAIPPMFLIVSNKVFGTSLNADALKTNDRLKSTFTVQIRIRAKTTRSFLSQRNVETVEYALTSPNLGQLLDFASSIQPVKPR
jgi:hypothetical protein